MNNYFNQTKEFIHHNLLFIIVLFLMIIFRLFVFPIYQVDGDSMEPILHHQEKILSTNFSELDRFDIVIAKDKRINKLYVKRIIGLPNEVVEYRNNKLFIDDKFVAEDFLSSDSLTEDMTYQLADNQYFIVGDNRNNSRDSRDYGGVDKAQIISEVKLRIWPINEFDSFANEH
ncbi:signal peptidase I [Facklamia lactis]|uniref:signal peptidase I n=1 Tax=Facklamia lactis TaxID=2749967 RepID=UPI0018CD2665|nr:signal peptidase I [Facklamia lactis]MBG9979524.1 signal peptidase I [Facklamia lactis]